MIDNTIENIPVSDVASAKIKETTYSQDMVLEFQLKEMEAFVRK